MGGQQGPKFSSRAGDAVLAKKAGVRLSLLEYPRAPDLGHLEYVASKFSLTEANKLDPHWYQRVDSLDAVVSFVRLLEDDFLRIYHQPLRIGVLDLIGHSGDNGQRASVGSSVVTFPQKWCAGRYIDQTRESVTPLQELSEVLAGGELRLLHCGSGLATIGERTRLIDKVREHLPFARVGGVVGIVEPGDFARDKSGFEAEPKLVYHDEEPRPLRLTDLGGALAGTAPTWPSHVTVVNEALRVRTHVRSADVLACYSDQVIVRPPISNRACGVVLNRDRLIGRLLLGGLILASRVEDQELVRLLFAPRRMSELLDLKIPEYLVAI